MTAKQPVSKQASDATTKLLNLITDQQLMHDTTLQTFESLNENGVTIYPLWFAGVTATGSKFDVMFEFLTAINRQELETIKRALMDVCDEAIKAIENQRL